MHEREPISVNATIANNRDLPPLTYTRPYSSNRPTVGRGNLSSFLYFSSSLHLTSSPAASKSRRISPRRLVLNGLSDNWNIAPKSAVIYRAQQCSTPWQLNFAWICGTEPSILFWIRDLTQIACVQGLL